MEVDAPDVEQASELERCGVMYLQLPCLVLRDGRDVIIVPTWAGEIMQSIFSVWGKRLWLFWLSTEPNTRPRCLSCSMSCMNAPLETLPTSEFAVIAHKVTPMPPFCACLPAGMAALLAACPTFETFWQGRLIPGACVDTLPFIRAVRCKRSAAAKDLLPDEVFNRVR